MYKNTVYPKSEIFFIKVGYSGFTCLIREVYTTENNIRCIAIHYNHNETSFNHEMKNIVTFHSTDIGVL